MPNMVSGEFVKNEGPVFGKSVDGVGNSSPSRSSEVGRWLAEKWDEEADVIVLGAGLAGLSAAIEAADAGAKVILLEKMSSVTSSHSTRCVGNVAGAGSKMQAKAGIIDSPKRWR
jgi:hypothetical protein